MPWVLRMILTISSMYLVVVLYLLWRFNSTAGALWPGRKKTVRLLSASAAGAFFLLPVIGYGEHLLGNSVRIGEYPDILVYLFWFGLAFSFQLLGWVVVLDLIKLFNRFIIKKNTWRIHRLHAMAVVMITGIIFIYSSVKLYLDSTRIRTDEVELRVDDLPDALDGFRIVHITDVQADEYTSREKIARYVDRINELESDLVIFTGDMVTNGTEYLEAAAQELSNVKATYGMYAVVGDHDYWAGMEEVREVLETYDLPLLEDENKDISVGEDAALRITGITQVYSHRAEREEVAPLFHNDPGVFPLLASHQISDDLLDLSLDAGYRLALVGHTHGGQIRLPVFWKKYSAPDFETRFVGGVYREGDLTVNVNNGLGFTLGPVRYNAPANISVIKLVRE